MKIVKQPPTEDLSQNSVLIWLNEAHLNQHDKVNGLLLATAENMLLLEIYELFENTAE